MGVEMIKVMIVDDQGLLRKSIGQILDSDDDIHVVGMASNGKEALEACPIQKPDVVLMDIEMPEMNGIISTQMIKKNFEDIKVIILTTFENNDNITEAFYAGADGYIVKDLSCDELLNTIKCVHSGFTVIHESAKRVMLKEFQQMSRGASSQLKSLVNEEIDIIRLIVMSKSNKEIAETLNYTEGTIKNKVSKIYEKLRIEDRVQLALFATQNGIV